MNAKKEFIDHTQGKKVKCASINFGGYYDDHDEYIENSIVLKCNFSESDYEEFLKKLDVDYDSGYGGQNLFGTIWYEDGTWSSRGEYDGSEWWEYNQCPEIDENCL